MGWEPSPHPTGKPQDFVTGFINAEGHARGCLVGVTFDPAKGALLIADDLSNTVWRVTAVVHHNASQSSAASSSASGISLSAMQARR